MTSTNNPAFPLFLSTRSDATPRELARLIEAACQDLRVDPSILRRGAAHLDFDADASSVIDVLIRLANDQVSPEYPDWTFVASRLFQQQWQREVVFDGSYPSFSAVVQELTGLGLYDPRIQATYNCDALAQFDHHLDPQRDALFTYSGIKHLYDRYAIRNADGRPRELPQHIFMGVAAFLALAEEPDVRVSWAQTFYDVLSQMYITMATPTLAQARRPQGQLSSCFVDALEDSITGIFDGLTSFAQISQNGGGLGVYLGHLRSLGSRIRGLPGVGGGVVPWVRLYNDTAVSVNQLGQRAGAVSVWLDVWHKDVLAFLDLKIHSGDERAKAYDVFPGLSVPDRFYQVLAANGTWHLFDPHEVEQVMGWRLENSWGDEWNARYDACIAEARLSRATVPALELMGAVLQRLYETGGPFIFHRDTVNRTNPNRHAGMIYASNLCTEICQNHAETRRTEQQLVDGRLVTMHQPGDLAVCNLSSLNLGRVVTAEQRAAVIPIQVRMLDDVITLNHLPIPAGLQTNQRYRAIGLGVSGYHQHLAAQGIDWASEAHLAYADALFEDIAYQTIQASCALARERGAYPLFPGSAWETGEYFETRGYTAPKWQTLADEVRRGGLRNGYLLAIAPTGSTSIIAGSTAGIDPIFAPIFTEEKKGMVVRQVVPGWNAETAERYRDAHHIDQRWTIRAAAKRQRHLDQAQSLNLYATPEVDANTLLEWYYLAWSLGVKTVYYFRNAVEIPEVDCVACQA